MGLQACNWTLWNVQVQLFRRKKTQTNPYLSEHCEEELEEVELCLEEESEEGYELLLEEVTGEDLHRSECQGCTAC